MKQLLCLLLTLNSFLPAYANSEITCKADILTSMCGSGEIAINLNTQDMSFELLHGDVGCWFTEITIEGKLKLVKTPHHLIGSTQYELIDESGEVILGQIIAREKDRYRKALARITINPNKIMIAQGALSGRYNLTCQ